MAEEGVGIAFGVPFPFKAEGAQIHLKVVEVRRRRSHAIARAKLDNALVLGLPIGRISGEGQIGRALRNVDRVRWAGVKLVVERKALRVIERACHFVIP